VKLQGMMQCIERGVCMGLDAP